MAGKDDLRVQRVNTVINTRSKRQEKALDVAVRTVEANLRKKFPGIVLHHVQEWKLRDVVENLRKAFPQTDFHFFFNTSAMRPDGGILSIVSRGGRKPSDPDRGKEEPGHK